MVCWASTSQYSAVRTRSSVKTGSTGISEGTVLSVTVSGSVSAGIVVSGVVSISSSSITASKHFILSGSVTIISLLDRSSAMISTLPRIIPRSASDKLVICDSLTVGCGGG